jgi:hypothetical protein
MLEALGVNFERRNGGWDDLGGQLQDGLLDAVAFAVGIPTPAISQIEVQAEVNFIDFNDTERAQVIEEFPVAEFAIPSGTYSTLDRDMKSVAMWNFAIANCDLPESFVYAATDIVMSDNDRMKNIHGSARETLPENWNKNTVMKWHPGAARWFRENAGAEIPDDMVFSAQ